MAYEGKCGSCFNFEENNGDKYNKNNADYVKGYCTWYGCYYYPDDSCESHYKKRDNSNNTCYITTMICNKLGFPDKCDSLNTLRGFRDTVLQKNSKYQDILYEYDTVGPKISECLEKEDINFIYSLYHTFIVPIVSFIKGNKNKEAILKYFKMTLFLEYYYNIDDSVKVPDNYDYTVGGHGYLKTR